MDDTLIRGDVVELQCVLAFQEKGYYCSLPFSGSCRYDVIADVDNKLYRIQCKSSVYHEDEGILIMSATRSTTNTKKTTRYKYTTEEIDYFFTSWKEYRFLIPVKEVSTEKSLRITEPKQGIQAQMSIASDYLFDNVLDAMKSNEEIKHYQDNCLISIDPTTQEEHLWSQQELVERFDERQIRYIRSCASQHMIGYQLLWKFKEFPFL